MPVWKSAFQCNPADLSSVKPAGPVDGSRRIPHLVFMFSLWSFPSHDSSKRLLPTRCRVAAISMNDNFVVFDTIF